VIGVSGDSAATHKLFKEHHKLNFTLLADEDGKIAEKFGVPVGKGGDFKVKDLDITIRQGVRASRWTFVIGKDGKVLYKNPKVSPAEDSRQVLEVLEKQGR
jgi:peroxiredoxin Q/BCP